MSSIAQLPDFACAEWYRDPRDHRSPHDAWLETLEITEPVAGERSEIRSTAITMRLLGAYHDGHIVFRYSGVESYSLAAQVSSQGLGDWLDDEFVPGVDGLFLHRICWSGYAPKGHCVWIIKARKVSYEWISKG